MAARSEITRWLAPALLALPALAAAADDGADSDDLAQLLAQPVYGNTRIAGASKYDQDTADAPGMAYVRTGGEIRAQGYRSLAEVLDSLNTLVELEKSHDFDESKDYIRRTIKREIVSAIAGQTGVYEEIVLRTDDAVRKAVEILQSGQYTKLITEGQKKAQAD